MYIWILTRHLIKGSILLHAVSYSINAKKSVVLVWATLLSVSPLRLVVLK